MALSDGKFLDAQAGAETFGSALLAALAGVNSVSGPGMLDYVLVFSLEKLVVDNDLCGQALHFVQQMAPQEDLPTVDLVRQLLDEQHLITAEHTLEHWPQSLYLPDGVIDRLNRENWQKAGSPTLAERAKTAVTQRLATYTPIDTDPRIDAEMRRLIRAGMKAEAPLPAVPEHSVPETAVAHDSPRRRRFRR
jgi:trimethylamine--corrinoid protein Co-methyltransferase